MVKLHNVHALRINFEFDYFESYSLINVFICVEVTTILVDILKVLEFVIETTKALEIEGLRAKAIFNSF